MNKLNHILTQWPPNTVITTKWLHKQGVSRQLADSYVNSGWLERVGRGAYKRPHQDINWAVGVSSLQNICNLNVHVGGKSALELLGYAHYVRLNTLHNIILWKRTDIRLPAWFENFEWEAELIVRSIKLFESKADFLTKKNLDGVALNICVAEQAILEYLHDLPKYESFDEAAYIIEGLSSLRPFVLQNLLENCKSIKVKRLFLYFAEMYSHAWFKKLDMSKIDLGSGKREIIKGGKLDKKYQIVVPELNREDR